MSWREREKRKKMPFIVATYVSSCSPRAAHALRLDQKMSLMHLIQEQLLRWPVCQRRVPVMPQETPGLVSASEIKRPGRIGS